jgi:hypothetical protein
MEAIMPNHLAPAAAAGWVVAVSFVSPGEISSGDYKRPQTGDQVDAVESTKLNGEASLRVTFSEIKSLAQRHGLDGDIVGGIIQTESARNITDHRGRPLIAFNPHVLQRLSAGERLGKYHRRLTREQVIESGTALVWKGSSRLASIKDAVSVDDGIIFEVRDTYLTYRDNWDRERVRGDTARDWSWTAYKVAVDRVGPETAAKAFAWGLNGVMGYNHKLVGYDTASDFARALMTGDKMVVLEAAVAFLAHNPTRKNGKTLKEAINAGDTRTIVAINAGTYSDAYHDKLIRNIEEAKRGGI